MKAISKKCLVNVEVVEQADSSCTKTTPSYTQLYNILCLHSNPKENDIDKMADSLSLHWDLALFPSEGRFSQSLFLHPSSLLISHS